ncbi:MAG: hypothetical protein RIR69_615 [Actinomycetota bacterium]|jgi:UPF0716 protein FxsA
MLFFFIVTLIVVVPLVELYFIVQVGQEIGILPTIAALIVISAIGSALVKREGLRVYKEFVTTIRSGQEPTRQIVAGVCVLAAGVMFLAPGFFTDVLAILLILPPTRRVLTWLVMRGTSRYTTVIRATHTGPIVDLRGHLRGSEDVIDVEPREGDEIL